jgi:hypothetical protein
MSDTSNCNSQAEVFVFCRTGLFVSMQPHLAQNRKFDMLEESLSLPW